MSLDHFEFCIEHVRLMEGGKVDRASDPGGPTNHGITQQLLDAVQGLLPDLPRTVGALTWDEAKRIYRHHFWPAVRGDDLPLGYALVTLDAAVNHGPRRAIRFLQLALGVTADGWIGAGTLAAAHARQTIEVLEECMARRTYFFMLQDSIDDEYGLGWARRVMRTFSVAADEMA